MAKPNYGFLKRQKELAKKKKKEEKLKRKQERNVSNSDIESAVDQAAVPNSERQSGQDSGPGPDQA